MIRLKRAYDEPSPEDGLRILVERLWPRGLTRERAAIDLWMKEVAPSAGLRSWFGHDPEKWEEFRARYRRELESSPNAVLLLREKAREGRVTLVYAARDTERNSAVLLKQFMERSGAERLRRTKTTVGRRAKKRANR